jgi:transposase
MPGHSKLEGAIHKQSWKHSSKEMRDRAVCLWQMRTHTWGELEQIFDYDRRTMRGWVADEERRAATGLAFVKMPRKGKHKLSEDAQAELIRCLHADPQIYYDELTWLVFTRTGESASLSTVRRVAVAAGFTIKAGSQVSGRRNAVTMRIHAELRERYHWSQFIFLDEAHKRGRDMVRKKGKVQGNRKCYVPLSDHLSRSWTMLAGINYLGLVGHQIQELRPNHSVLPSAITRELWIEMFKKKILPKLGDARLGELNSVVIIVSDSRPHLPPPSTTVDLRAAQAMRNSAAVSCTQDNASLHWGCDHDCMLNELNELVKSRGAVLIYTPPYCPRSNAIEPVFKAMNDYIARDRVTARDDPEEAIRLGLLSGGQSAMSFVQRSVKDVRGWLDGRGVHGE